jgi:hypothetical protein
MTEAGAGREVDAVDMPSWSASGVRNEQAATPLGATDAPDIDAARKLLEELFSEPPADENPLQPEQ